MRVNTVLIKANYYEKILSLIDAAIRCVVNPFRKKHKENEHDSISTAEISFKFKTIFTGDQPAERG